MGDVKIEKTEKFCYLGHMMAKDGCAVISDAAIKYRKGQERSKIAQIKPLLIEYRREYLFQVYK